MNPGIWLAAILFFFHAFQNCSAGPACPDCLSVIYNERKANISTLLAQTETGISLFATGLANLTASKVTDPNNQNVLTAWSTEMEDGIIKNDSLSDDQKLRRIGMKLDQLFLNFPAIEAAIRFEKIGSWGPLCDFSYIIDEFNIPFFWEIVSTPGTTTTCLLHDLILTAAKDNVIIQRDLYLKNCACSKSFDMVSDLVNIHLDTPNPVDQLVLKSLELADYEMTVNQVQRVATAYYTTKSLSCRRLRDTFANFPAADIPKNFHNLLTPILGRAAKSISSEKNVQVCAEFYSGEIYQTIRASKNVKIFTKIFWNDFYGSMYDIIIYYDSQLSVLKENAPEYYN